MSENTFEIRLELEEQIGAAIKKAMDSADRAISAGEKKIGKSTKTVSKDFTKMESRIGKATKAIAQKVKVMVSKMGSGFKKIGSAMSNVAKGVASKAKLIGVAMVGIGAISIRSAMKFEEGMAKISTLMDNVTKGELEEISNGLKKFSIQYAQTADSLLDAEYDILSAGFQDVSESLEMIEVSSKLAVGGVSDVKITADLLTSTLNAYQKTTKEALSVSDDFFQIVKLGKTEIKLLAQYFPELVATGAAYEISVKELGAALATLTAGGIKTSKSNTSLRATINGLVKPTEAMKGLIQEQGFETGALMLKNIGLAGSIKMLGNAVKSGNYEWETLFSSIEANTAVLPLAGKMADDYIKKQKGMTDTIGETGKAVDKITATTMFKYKQGIQQVNDEMIKLGTEMMPMVIKLLPEFVKVFKGALPIFGLVAKSISFIALGLNELIAVLRTLPVQLRFAYEQSKAVFTGVGILAKKLYLAVKKNFNLMSASIMTTLGKALNWVGDKIESIAKSAIIPKSIENKMLNFADSITGAFDKSAQAAKHSAEIAEKELGRMPKDSGILKALDAAESKRKKALGDIQKQRLFINENFVTPLDAVGDAILNMADNTKKAFEKTNKEIKKTGKELKKIVPKQKIVVDRKMQAELFFTKQKTARQAEINRTIMENEANEASIKATKELESHTKTMGIVNSELSNFAGSLINASISIGDSIKNFGKNFGSSMMKRMVDDVMIDVSDEIGDAIGATGDTLLKVAGGIMSMYNSFRAIASGETDSRAGIASMTMQGTAMGASVGGPIGAGVGAVMGAQFGWIGARKGRKEQKKDIKKQIAAMAEQREQEKKWRSYNDPTSKEFQARWGTRMEGIKIKVSNAMGSIVGSVGDMATAIEDSSEVITDAYESVLSARSGKTSAAGALTSAIADSGLEEEIKSALEAAEITKIQAEGSQEALDNALNIERIHHAIGSSWTTIIKAAQLRMEAEDNLVEKKKIAEEAALYAQNLIDSRQLEIVDLKQNLIDSELHLVAEQFRLINEQKGFITGTLGRGLATTAMQETMGSILSYGLSGAEAEHVASWQQGGMRQALTPMAGATTNNSSSTSVGGTNVTINATLGSQVDVTNLGNQLGDAMAYKLKSNMGRI